jgi:hypothetical protein
MTPQPGDQTQTVTVTESITLVDAASATALSNAEINDLPLNGRNYQNLLGLRPGGMLQPGDSPWTQSTNNVRPDETVHQMAYFLAAPLVPFLLLARMAQRVWRHHCRLEKFAQAVLLIPAPMVYVAGEFVGYLIVPGDALLKVE